MRRATAALRGHLANLLRAIDVEGAFVITGVAAVAYGSGLFDWRFPPLVVGIALVVTGIALALPEPKKPAP